jgi:hypothetical protein
MISQILNFETTKILLEVGYFIGIKWLIFFIFVEFNPVTLSERYNITLSQAKLIEFNGQAIQERVLTSFYHFQ